MRPRPRSPRPMPMTPRPTNFYSYKHSEILFHIKTSHNSILSRSGLIHSYVFEFCDHMRIGTVFFILFINWHIIRVNVFLCMSFLSISFWKTPVAGTHFPGGKFVIKLGLLSWNGFYYYCLYKHSKILFNIKTSHKFILSRSGLIHAYL